MMVSQSPIERAMRAYLAHLGDDPDALVAMIGGPPVPAWKAYAPAMRAALMAIREASEVMATAGIDSGGIAESRFGEDAAGDAFWARQVWQAMLDAAILEGPDEMV